jgi:hypothetical protein
MNRHVIGYNSICEFVVRSKCVLMTWRAMSARPYAAVHIHASGGGLRADSASGITLVATNGGVTLDIGDGNGGGGVFSVLSSGSRTFAVDASTAGAYTRSLFSST